MQWCSRGLPGPLPGRANHPLEDENEKKNWEKRWYVKYSKIKNIEEIFLSCPTRVGRLSTALDQRKHKMSRTQCLYVIFKFLYSESSDMIGRMGEKYNPKRVKLSCQKHHMKVVKEKGKHFTVVSSVNPKSVNGNTKKHNK